MASSLPNRPADTPFKLSVPGEHVYIHMNRFRIRLLADAAGRIEKRAKAQSGWAA